MGALDAPCSAHAPLAASTRRGTRSARILMQGSILEETPMEQEQDWEAVRGGDRATSALSPRAFISGAIVTLAVATVLSVLAGGFGLMSFDTISAEEVRRTALGLGIWMGIAWILAASVGGYVAGSGAGTVRRRDGMLNGLVSWAIACVFGGTLLIGLYLLAIPVGLASPDVVGAVNGVGAHWGFFLADAGAAVGALLAGDLAVRGRSAVRPPRRAAAARRAEPHPA